jgi:hypothetical protein
MSLDEEKHKVVFNDFSIGKEEKSFEEFCNTQMVGQLVRALTDHHDIFLRHFPKSIAIRSEIEQRFWRLHATIDLATV